MDLEAVRRRGRWQSQTSVQIYTKTHLLLEKQTLLSAEQVRRGTDIWMNVEVWAAKCGKGNSTFQVAAWKAAQRMLKSGGSVEVKTSPAQSRDVAG